MLWMWWNWTFHQRVSKQQKEVFKPDRGGKEDPGHPSDQKERSSNCDRRTRSGRRGNPRGWARTGLEPETKVNINCIPYDAIVDIGSSLSMMDTELCESLCLSVNPFIHNISHYVGVEGASMSGSAITILGWVEVNLGISFMGNNDS